MKNVYKKLLYVLLFLFGIGVDCIVKIIIRKNMTLGQSVPVIEGVFHITYTENTGAAFSMLSGKTALLAIFTAVVVAFLLYFVFADRLKGNIAPIIVTLIACGGTGNLIDRVFRGSVTDMFDFCLIDFAIFNVADIFVTCGAIAFVICFICTKGEVIKSKNSSEITTDNNTEG